MAGYDNYVAKCSIDGKEYFVCFTVMNEKDGRSGIYSSMVINVFLYEETADVASTSATRGGRLVTEKGMYHVESKVYRQRFEVHSLEKLPRKSGAGAVGRSGGHGDESESGHG